MNQWLLLIIAVFVPFITLLGIQILRGFAGIWHSGGADFIGLFVVVDATIAFDPEPFRTLVFTEALKSFVGQAALVSLLAGALVLLPVTVIYGERKMAHAEIMRALGLPQNLPKLPLIVVWACAIFYVSIHWGFVFGDWS